MILVIIKENISIVKQNISTVACFLTLYLPIAPIWSNLIMENLEQYDFPDIELMKY
jgi:hypothetical protein